MTPEAQRVVAVIQARMGSARLPGKVLRNLAGRPVLQWVIEAAIAAEGIDEVLVATSSNAGDDPIVDLSERLGVRTIRGSEDDVLERFLLAASDSDADAVVRLTSDCPLLDPVIISQVVALWRTDPRLDYVSTTLSRSLPRGLDVELVRVSALERVRSRPEPHHHAHVTSAVYEAGAGFACAGLVMQPDSSHYRVTLDTPEDAELLDQVVAVLPAGSPNWRDVVALLDRRPEIAAVNAHVSQKPLVEG
jgi:spore coat polysaccharide biosynthesis protein SpsF